MIHGITRLVGDGESDGIYSDVQYLIGNIRAGADYECAVTAQGIVDGQIRICRAVVGDIGGCIVRIICGTARSGNRLIRRNHCRVFLVAYTDGVHARQVIRTVIESKFQIVIAGCDDSTRRRVARCRRESNGAVIDHIRGGIIECIITSARVGRYGRIGGAVVDDCALRKGQSDGRRAESRVADVIRCGVHQGRDAGVESRAACVGAAAARRRTRKGVGDVQTRAVVVSE